MKNTLLSGGQFRRAANILRRNSTYNSNPKTHQYVKYSRMPSSSLLIMALVEFNAGDKYPKKLNKIFEVATLNVHMGIMTDE